MSSKVTDAPAVEESAKRRQIMEGARQLFLTHGFDAASMGEIARVAGVSKGTLYVYFENKESLFEAIVEDERAGQAQQVFALDASDHNVEAVLTRLGDAYVRFLCQPSAMSALRTVIGIAERMPEIGRKFYEFGPQYGIQRLSQYLEAQVKAGVVAIDDCEVAAAQFLDSCQSTMFKPVLFAAAPAPSDERIAHVIGIAVRTFMASYGKR
ncbi:Transcriptional regulator, TetR family [Candidatus Filomicrobium marinum]|uniref:Transcriptional regulator, TetR family n=2 Tax=Filomicrobium TaxID=119044 RepID=A0A0D6JJA8_9HYPH|nr:MULTISPECIES: TetR/AcrR family transcriptional regulator [Filomicrobium]CFX31116.1 Transcriptional regulator, TetR family [Candidatus Filomicrobium marinum]CPR22043.1 Transcriptional regulator, TetR family [Candidatus Filomicrobium marinum]SDP45188.1 transcriptional regulator, TetR family [Filomicrobium insigne]